MPGLSFLRNLASNAMANLKQPREQLRKIRRDVPKIPRFIAGAVRAAWRNLTG